MNLLDIRTRAWSKICLDATAPSLERLLGQPQPSTSVLVSLGHFSHEERPENAHVFFLLQGSISTYFVHRYGFSKGCSVVTFTGDNPGTRNSSCVESSPNGWLMMCFLPQPTKKFKDLNYLSTHWGHWCRALDVCVLLPSIFGRNETSARRHHCKLT